MYFCFFIALPLLVMGSDLVHLLGLKGFVVELWHLICVLFLSLGAYLFWSEEVAGSFFEDGLFIILYVFFLSFALIFWLGLRLY